MGGAFESGIWYGAWTMGFLLGVSLFAIVAGLVLFGIFALLRWVGRWFEYAIDAEKKGRL